MRNGSWQHTTLGTLAAARGRSLDPSKYPNDFFELYSVPSFPERKPEIIAGKEIDSNKQQVHFRSVLLCKINPRINRVWIVGNASKYPKIASTEWIIFPQQEGIEPRFLCYFLQQNVVRDFLAANASGVGGSLMRVKPSTLRDFPFAYPEGEVQERIVAEIEKQFTRLDAGVASLKQVQIALKRYRASVLKAACEGRLVPTEAELSRKENRSYETAEQLLQRILKERCETRNGKGKYKEPARPNTVDLPALPEGWAWTTVGQLACSVKDGPHYSPEYVTEGIPFITGGNVRPSGIDFASAKRISRQLHAELSKRCKPSVGDILYTKGGTTGVARVNTYDREFNVWVHVAVLKLIPSIHRFFLQHALNSPFCYAQAQRFTHGVGNQDLGLTRMVNIVVPLPPLTEQARIAAEVDRRLSVIEKLEAVVVANLQRAVRIRRSILQRAFEGNLTSVRQ